MTETKNCQNCKQDFTIEQDDFDFYAKIKVPPPTFCSECRNRQRMATRNVKTLYKRECDNCRTVVVSRFSIINPAKMFCRDCWWGDGWEALSYGKDYDFSRPFFEQFHELLFSVPHVALFSANMIRSDYSNMESDNKDCYLTFGGHWNENCAYTEYVFKGKEVYDTYWAWSCEQAYECMNLEKCYRIFYSSECKDCLDTYFSYDCRNCNEVIGCAGLRNKSYCIFNEQYSKEEYFTEKAKLNLGSRNSIQDLKKKSRKVWLGTPHVFMTTNQSVNCTGNDIVNSKNSKYVWQVEGVEDSKNLYIAAWHKDCRDETSTAGNELGYQNASGGGMYNCNAVLYSFAGDFKTKKHTQNSEYSYTVLSCTNCFGCVGLRNKQYCILNKQYTKEEYEELLPKIKQQMKDMPYISPNNNQIYSYGDFFPWEHSLHSYNETVANDFYPVIEQEAKKSGFLWRDEPTSDYNFTNYVIPDHIDEVENDILNAVLKCEDTGKGYKITKEELAFYKKMQIPIPVTSPLQRIRRRVRELLPMKLWYRDCMCNKEEHGHASKCLNEFETSYAPDRPEVIYCESCYHKEVV